MTLRRYEEAISRLPSRESPKVCGLSSLIGRGGSASQEGCRAAGGGDLCGDSQW
jgi:hypothetical protein